MCIKPDIAPVVVMYAAVDKHNEGLALVTLFSFPSLLIKIPIAFINIFSRCCYFSLCMLLFSPWQWTIHTLVLYLGHQDKEIFPVNHVAKG